MDIDAIEARRELDALVAEKVMGWEWDDSNPLQRLMYDSAGYVAAVIFAEGENAGQVEALVLPPFSSHIAAAWQVVEKMREQGIAMVVSTLGPRSQTSAHTIWNSEPSKLSWADAAPLAICRAALKAVMKNS